MEHRTAGLLLGPRAQGLRGGLGWGAVVGVAPDGIGVMSRELGMPQRPLIVGLARMAAHALAPFNKRPFRSCPELAGSAHS
jgi:hypothetical protein